MFTTWNDGGFRLVGGTSIAAPQVAAAYALYRAAWPDATAAELKQALLDDVDPVPAFAGKSVTGGRLSIGSLADGALGAVRYTFTSMTAPAGVVAPGHHRRGRRRHAATTRSPSASAWSRAARSGRSSDKELTLGGTTLTTDDSGEALFALGSATSLADLTLSPSMDLGDGRYVLTVQLYRDGTVLGRTFAAPLLVGTAVTTPGWHSGAPAPARPGTGTPGTGTPGTGTPGTGTPGTGTPGTGTRHGHSGHGQRHRYRGGHRIRRLGRRLRTRRRLRHPGHRRHPWHGRSRRRNSGTGDTGDAAAPGQPAPARRAPAPAPADPGTGGSTRGTGSGPAPAPAPAAPAGSAPRRTSVAP